MNRKTALVTGATGFVGAHLSRRLAAERWNVHVLVRPNSDLSPIQKILDQVTVHRHDGTIGDMTQIMEQARPDVVFHLASLFLAQHEPKDVELLIHSNVVFSTMLVEAMARKGVRHLINTGTSWQHYDHKPYSPVCLYAATKQAFEAILTYYEETTPLQVITLTLFDTYGPMDNRAKLFSLLNQIDQGTQPFAMSGGEQLIDLVYIDDVIDAYLIAAHQLLEEGQIVQREQYAVCSGNPIQLKALVQMYCRITGKQLLIEWGGRPYRPREVMIPWNKGMTLPGWQPKVSIEEGMRRIVKAKQP